MLMAYVEVFGSQEIIGSPPVQIQPCFLSSMGELATNWSIPEHRIIASVMSTMSPHLENHRSRKLSHGKHAILAILPS